MTSVVLSNLRQYELWNFEQSKSSTSHRVYCDNEKFYDELVAKGVSCELLDEFLLKPEWNAINSWGCGTAAEFTQRAKASGLFDAIDVPSCIYLFFSTQLSSRFNLPTHRSLLS